MSSDKVVYSQILAENERYSINICYKKLYFSINVILSHNIMQPVHSKNLHK